MRSGRRYSGFTMFDILLITGQTASALLLLYGAFLTLMSAREARAANPMLEDKMFLLGRLQNGA